MLSFTQTSAQELAAPERKEEKDSINCLRTSPGMSDGLDWTGLDTVEGGGGEQNVHQSDIHHGQVLRSSFSSRMSLIHPVGTQITGITLMSWCPLCLQGQLKIYTFHMSPSLLFFHSLSYVLHLFSSFILDFYIFFVIKPLPLSCP